MEHSLTISDGILPFFFFTLLSAYRTPVLLCSTSLTTLKAPVPMTFTRLRSWRVTFVSWIWMRLMRSSRILPLTISPKVALSIVQISELSLETLTVAVLRSSKSRARSPKQAFRPCVRTRLSLIKMETSPFEITYMESPLEPCSMTSSSLLKCWSRSAATTLSVCSWLRCRKTGTFLTRSILAAYSAACSGVSSEPLLPSALTMLSRERRASLAPPGPPTKSSSLGARVPALHAAGESTPSLLTETRPEVSTSQHWPLDAIMLSSVLCRSWPETTIRARVLSMTERGRGSRAVMSSISMACITADCCARPNCEKSAESLRP
mmetsp:Transcript_44388/g.128446  ORF Transcript_44388/g.128446 Transcript_44388/m.128446 type:complete len:321 (+) Transcript_44388:868-1830(+)